MLATRVLRIGIATWLLAGAASAQGASDVIPRPAAAPRGPAVPGEPGASPGSTGLEAGGVEKGGGAPSPPPASAPGDASGPESGPPEGAAAVEPSKDADRAPPASATPPAADTLGGHFVLSIGGGIASPYGHLSSDTGQQRVVGPGPAGTLELGFGVSRTLVLGAWGQAQRLGPGNLCNDSPSAEEDCTATSLAGGAMLRFHLVQGVRFDPWLSAGMGLRNTKIDAGQSYSYFGLDALRLAFGGDWYALRNVGVGSWLELDASVYTSRPELAPTARTARDETAALALSFLFGARLTLDLPGR